MSSVSIYVTLALCLTWFVALPCHGQSVQLPKYITVSSCDEVCRLHPEAECRLDCLEGPEEGQYNDCINHFYYSNGFIEYHCDWD
ncbi:hypothetical protein BsWGS_09993 [Bradybaena similaris]